MGPYDTEMKMHVIVMVSMFLNYTHTVSRSDLWVTILMLQELTLTNERFLVPEMLFHPADLGCLFVAF